MKAVISIPDDLFQAAERAARRLGVSRSKLFARAIAQFLEKQTDAQVTETLDQVYGSAKPAALDSVLERMQRGSLPQEEW